MHSTSEQKIWAHEQRLAPLLTLCYGLHSFHRPSDPPLRVVWWFFFVLMLAAALRATAAIERDVFSVIRKGA